MENNVSLYLKKYGIAAIILLDQIICIFILSRGQNFETSKLYVHILSLGFSALMLIKYPAYQRINWRAMLIMAILLLIFYLMEVRYSV